jgi:hypothetical protein
MAPPTPAPIAAVVQVEAVGEEGRVAKKPDWKEFLKAHWAIHRRRRATAARPPGEHTDVTAVTNGR